MLGPGPDAAKEKGLDRFKMHSIPKGTMKKIFGQETKHIGFKEQDSTFRQHKFASSDHNQPAFHYGAPYPEGVTRDRMKVDSIPKETMKKVFGLETLKIGYAPQKSSFERHKMVSTEKNQPCFHMGSQYGEALTRDKYKVDSIPKETMKLVFGRETGHVGYIAPDSTFRRGKILSKDENQPCFHMGSQYGEALTRDKYKVDSIPKETMKLVFGRETGKVGFIAPESTFRRGKFNSTDENQPCFHMGSAYGEALTRDKYKVDSIPKETMKLVFGRETGHIGYIAQESALSKVAYSFGTADRPGQASNAKTTAAQLAGSKTKVEFTPVADMINYRQQLAAEARQRQVSGQEAAFVAEQERAALWAELQRQHVAKIAATERFCGGKWGFERVRGWVRDKLESKLKAGDTPMQEMFKMLGRPREGVTAAIFHKVLQAWGLPITAPETAVLFGAFDLGGGGVIKFHSFMTRLLGKPTEPGFMAQPAPVPLTREQARGSNASVDALERELLRRQAAGAPFKSEKPGDFTFLTAVDGSECGGGGGGGGSTNPLEQSMDQFAPLRTIEKFNQGGGGSSSSSISGGSRKSTVAQLVLTARGGGGGGGRRGGRGSLGRAGAAAASMGGSDLPAGLLPPPDTARSDASTTWEPSTPRLPTRQRDRQRLLEAAKRDARVGAIGVTKLDDGGGGAMNVKAARKQAPMPPLPQHLKAEQEPPNAGCSSSSNQEGRPEWLRPGTQASRPGTSASALGGQGLLLPRGGTAGSSGSRGGTAAEGGGAGRNNDRAVAELRRQLMSSRGQAGRPLTSQELLLSGRFGGTPRLSGTNLAAAAAAARRASELKQKQELQRQQDFAAAAAAAAGDMRPPSPTGRHLPPPWDRPNTAEAEEEEARKQMEWKEVPAMIAGMKMMAPGRSKYEQKATYVPAPLSDDDEGAGDAQEGGGEEGERDGEAEDGEAEDGEAQAEEPGDAAGPADGMQHMDGAEVLFAEDFVFEEGEAAREEQEQQQQQQQQQLAAVAAEAKAKAEAEAAATAEASAKAAAEQAEEERRRQQQQQQQQQAEELEQLQAEQAAEMEQQAVSEPDEDFEDPGPSVSARGVNRELEPEDPVEALTQFVLDNLE